jgi:hypothetical protein
VKGLPCILLLALALAGCEGDEANEASEASFEPSKAERLDCGDNRAGSKAAMHEFAAILRRGERAEIAFALAPAPRFQWISVDGAEGPGLLARGDPGEAARVVARRGGLPFEITRFTHAERPGPSTDFGFEGVWEGDRALNGKAALDCQMGAARVLSLGIPPSGES